MLDKRFAVLATAEQIDKMSGRIGKNEQDISAIKGELRQLNKKITEQESKTPIKAKEYTHLNGVSNGRAALPPLKEMSYSRARRSLRIWPIEGTNEQKLRETMEKFMTDALKITPIDVSGIGVEEIRRARSSPNSNTFLEVIVTFAEIDDRDFVASRAVNLADHVNQDGRPKAGIRMDVPAFLLSTFKDLNSYAYNVRKSRGKKAKTHIKFDDQNGSLILELRLPGSENWLKITPTRARELNVEANAEELARLQRELKSRAARRSSEQDDSWSDSVNSLPLGGRSRSTSSTWQPPERGSYSGVGYGGPR